MPAQKGKAERLAEEDVRLARIGRIRESVPVHDLDTAARESRLRRYHDDAAAARARLRTSLDKNTPAAKGREKQSDPESAWMAAHRRPFDT